MQFPDNLWYDKQGFWVQIENGIATIGASEWLVEQHGQLVYVQYNETDSAILTIQGLSGPREYSRAADGDPIADGANIQILEGPVSVHNDPYSADNWFYKLKLKDPNARTWLLTAAQFRSSVGQ